MRIIYKRCCGLDVHKKVIVACLLLLEPDGELRQEIRKFGTMTKDLLELLDWLQQAGCTHQSHPRAWRDRYRPEEGHSGTDPVGYPRKISTGKVSRSSPSA